MQESAVKLLGNPYGEAIYENFKSNNRAFADKSLIIESLEQTDMPRYPVLLRPRRFGKSTFVQMLKCFYDISYKERYRKIFFKTAIYSKKLNSHNSYHVLNFDFSRVGTQSAEAVRCSFFSAVALGIDNFMRRYPDFEFSYDGLNKSDSVTLFNNFVSAYLRYSDQGRLYVMIDEYDNFANQILSHDSNLFKRITGDGGFLKDFYAAIKASAGDGGCIARTFITGVSSVSLDSLTSGFNIARNVTARECFNNYAGFTEDELRALIPQLVDITRLGVDVSEILAKMKPVYDGYCFSRFAKNTVYNSSMCLYYLDEMRLANEFLSPEQYTDPASDHDGSKLRQLFTIAEDGLADVVIDTYLSGNDFFVSNLAENINLNESEIYDRTQLLSMLYYLGYLTIDPERSSKDGLALKIPNIFMSKLFARCVSEMRFRSNVAFTRRSLDITPLLKASDDISTFVSSCTDFLTGIFSNQVLSHMNEMALNLALFAKLESLEGLLVELQKSLMVPGEGEKYADLVITANHRRSKECIYIIELKYVAKNETSAAKIEKLRREAARQLRAYRSALEFKGRNVKSYPMIFSGSGCVYCRKLRG
ncbi:MAG: AAA family ATPase [Succinivibrionaceae bacterium]|nr:AAA family ATPase [Succinivibrionaceae bacterium]